MTFLLWQIVVMFGAAYLAGVMNALAGGGTLLTFPALIWIGLDPIVANITSTLALLPGALSSFFGYRKEISGGRQWLKWLLLPSLIGGLLGALLLLFTPAKFFAAIVPLLILFATLLFALQEPLNQRLRKIRQPVANHTEAFADDNANRWQPPMSAAPTPRDAEPQPLRAPHLDGKWLIGAVVVQFLVALYGGYFGAGIGILMLATLGLIGLTDIHQMNGLKNLLGFTINGIAALSFVFSGQVKWSAALVMAIASILGGYSGAHLARRFGRTFARRAVIVIGVLMTISLFFH